MSKTVLKTVAGVAALAAIAFGASAIAGASGGASSSNAAGRMGPPGQMPQGGAPPGSPGFGSPVSGATAAKVKAAALAKYPGTVERVMALPNGGYVAHVFQKNGNEVHVHVNSQFQVTGIDSGAPGPSPAGGMPPGTSS
jgi:hypothetical protein